MKTFPIEGPFVDQANEALAQVPLFSELDRSLLGRLTAAARLKKLDTGEVLVEQAAAADSFFVVMTGEAAVRITPDDGGEPVEVATLGRTDAIGEMALILGETRTATVVAASELYVLEFSAEAFHKMFEAVPGFGMAVSRSLAERLKRVSRSVPASATRTTPPEPRVLDLLPFEFLQRHRVLPLEVEGNVLTLGFIHEPTAQTIAGVRQLLPSFSVRPAQIHASLFDETLATRTGVAGWARPTGPDAMDMAFDFDMAETAASSPRLDALLRRMVAEGASDLHLAAGHRPRWRVDGEIRELTDANVLASEEVRELLEPVLREGDRERFRERNDLDFAYAIRGLARFRANLFRDHRGVGAVLRLIPDRILTAEQLGLPPVVIDLASAPKGLVLVTGPTGSGKSTTLAAMLDHINDTRADHVITMEDPIEFVHTSRQSLFNQREIGPHSDSFHAALKAALRQDPDIVLVGEMRDRETIELALETANTGHLVFGTLHTSTAISTVERVVNVFPPEQQEQVRSSLADCLMGVVAQCLCRRVGGGRIAALEVLVASAAVRNLIRTGKTHQIASSMATGLQLGNRLLNGELARLVGEGKVRYDEALSKAVDKADLAKRCGREAE